MHARKRFQERTTRSSGSGHDPIVLISELAIRYIPRFLDPPVASGRSSGHAPKIIVRKLGWRSMLNRTHLRSQGGFASVSHTATSMVLFLLFFGFSHFLICHILIHPCCRATECAGLVLQTHKDGKIERACSRRLCLCDARDGMSV